MWKLIRAELSYNNILFFSLAGIVLILAYLHAFPFMEDLPVIFFVFWSAFMFLQLWTILRNKEKRIRMWAVLPVSCAGRAVSRILIVVGVSVLYHTLFLLGVVVLNPDRLPLITRSIQPIGMLMLMFSGYYLFRDTLVTALRGGRLRWLTPERSKMLIKGFVFALFLGNIYLYILASRGADLTFLGAAIHFFRESPLFTRPWGLMIFSIFCFVLSGLTLISYAGRKRYAE